MDNLLCDESWLWGPSTPEPLPNFRHDDHVEMSPAMDAATVEEAISMDLEKELRFSNHGDKFIEFLVSRKLIDDRFLTIQWLIQTRNRLNFSYETIFTAASCFDRFVYATSCKEWSKWMEELVAVTSLSIASKFNEVTSPSLEDFQKEGLNHMFHHKTVLEMELIMLRAIEWRVNSVTSLSFSQILVTKLGMAGRGEDMMMNRITDHLLYDLCDVKILGYAPSVVAVAAVWNILEEDLGNIMNLFAQEHKENIVKCVHAMKSRDVENGLRRQVGEVDSPASVLQRCDVMNMNIVYYVGNLPAIFQILPCEGVDKKRDRDDDIYEDEIRPAKRKTFVTSN